MSFHHSRAIIEEVIKDSRNGGVSDELKKEIVLNIVVITEIPINKGQGLGWTRWKGWLFIS